MNIIDVISSVPQTRISLDSLLVEGIISESDIRRLHRRGIHFINYDHGVTAIDLIHSCLDQLQSMSQWNGKRVKHLIICYNSAIIPHTIHLPSMIRERIPLPEAEIISVRDLYCSTPMMGIAMAKQYLDKSGDRSAMAIILTVERSGTLQYHYDGWYATGDSSAAALIGNEGQGDVVLAVRQVIEILPDAPNGTPHGHPYIPLLVYRLLGKTLKEAGIMRSDIRLIITNNIYSEVWSAISSLLQIPFERFYSGQTDGHGLLVMSDILLNYANARNEGVLKSGDYFVFLSLGLNGGAGCAVCKRL